MYLVPCSCGITFTVSKDYDHQGTAWNRYLICPHCGKPYRTLLSRQYRVRIDGGIKQSIPMGSLWRCMACGKTYSTQDE